MMVITVGASLRAAVWLWWHTAIKYSWKQMLLCSPAHWPKHPLKNARILNEFPNRTLRLIPRQEKVKSFTCYRRREETDNYGGRRTRMGFIPLQVAVLSASCNKLLIITISFSSWLMPRLAQSISLIAKSIYWNGLDQVTLSLDYC